MDLLIELAAWAGVLAIKTPISVGAAIGIGLTWGTFAMFVASYEGKNTTTPMSMFLGSVALYAVVSIFVLNWYLPTALYAKTANGMIAVVNTAVLAVWMLVGGLRSGLLVFFKRLFWVLAALLLGIYMMIPFALYALVTSPTAGGARYEEFKKDK